MKKVLSLALLAAVGVFIVFMTGCDGELPGEVRNLAAEAADEGASVKLTWTEPTDATGDETYSVYFDETLVEEEISVTEYKHFEPGKAGEYEVTVVSGNEESEGVKIDTEPVTPTTHQVYELNGELESGLGWNVSTGSAATYSMANDNSKTNIHCYFTDLEVGFAGDYNLAGAYVVETDPGNTWMPNTSGWDQTTVTDPLDESFDNVTIAPGANNYYNYSPATIGETYAIQTEDGHYGLVEVSGIDKTYGTVDVKVTFQPIQELRLF
ncbi:MAG: fibronectin type III domain-containing protein [Candidatus Stahlbacteria bacterium]|nr:MAG: fibronectin type III domain-containing protein [Candidatus Stahlbacteria bacterium]